MRFALLGLALAWAACSSCEAAEPVRARHCQSADDRTCTEAIGRSDAAYLIARKKIELLIWGGPAAPQPAMGIVLDEYRKAGIEAWLIGDMLIMPGSPEDLYYKGFNETMEKAIAAQRGAAFLERVRARMSERIKRAEAAERKRRQGLGSSWRPYNESVDSALKRATLPALVV
jgi:hypothetical protein